MRKLPLIAGLAIVAACSDVTSPNVAGNPSLKPSSVLAAGNTTVVVRPTDMGGSCSTSLACEAAYPNQWLFYDDNSDVGNPSLGSVTTGPSTPTNGIGSARISVAGAQRSDLATYQFGGIALSDIATLKFSTYNPSAGNGGSASRSGYLQFNVDFNGSDTWQRRLVFVPADNGTVTQDSWKEWDAINSGNAVWRYSGGTWPGQAVGGTKTWQQILSEYPGVRIRPTDAHLSIRVGEPYADGYTENIDSFTFGTAAGTTIFDFEPTLGACDVSVSAQTITLEDDCTTDRTLYIPNGFTLDGNDYTITAVDPAGGHFLGAVLTNAGSTAHVHDLTVTATGLVDACDPDGSPDRLRGILFDNASGSITNNVVTGVRQGLSGCQEGNAIEVRKAPFAGLTGTVAVGPDVTVTISGNTVSDYQKNGITANGAVIANILNNTVTGDGSIAYIAQNGIQVGWGGTAVIKGNRVTGNSYAPGDWTACGILLYRADGVKASSNNVYGNQKDMCNYGKGGGNVKASN